MPPEPAHAAQVDLVRTEGSERACDGVAELKPDRTSVCGAYGADSICLHRPVGSLFDLALSLLLSPGHFHREEMVEYLACRMVRIIGLRAANVEIQLHGRGIYRSRSARSRLA